ncbi:class II fructose-bisphosphate aldolase [Actinomadura sp. K4S16]|uniref:class II fructose-bisphosphate aldolase n=1 Tax=Actinomadura sp. K4S16 TaxID=1316147 RepID=UPI001F1B0987|nr:class II fructose-bisphosphate aldolase [Actinomadura sp. K4S16]
MALPALVDPDEAAGYVAATGVDALGVAVGTSHAMLARDTVLDLALIARLRAAVPVPLVLHGSSGVPDEGLAAAVEHGMTKINVATRLNKAFTAAVRARLAADPPSGRPAPLRLRRPRRGRRRGRPPAGGHRRGPPTR